MSLTSEQIQTRLDNAVARLTGLQTELDRKEAILRSGRDVNGDGVFDEGDLREVERVRARRDSAEARIEVLRGQLIIRQAEEEGRPTEIIDFEDEGSFVEGDTHSKPFSEDRNQFVTQVAGWRTEAKEALGRMVNAMLDPSDPGPGFPKNEIIGLASAALSATGPQGVAAAGALGIANTILDLAINAYGHALPARPSLREVETNWRDALDAISDTVIGDQYDALCDVFRSAHNMDAGEANIYATYIEEWDALIDAFRGGRVLPSTNSINRAFMSHIISEMPDSSWDMDLTSGVVTVYMEFDTERNTFSFSSGSMDDITNEVKQGLEADPDMFGTNGVIDLPVPIEFHISGSGWLDGTYCQCRRSARVSGDTSFQLSPMPIGADATLEEQSTMFQIFMNRAIYNQVSVRQIL